MAGRRRRRSPLPASATDPEAIWTYLGRSLASYEILLALARAPMTVLPDIGSNPFVGQPESVVAPELESMRQELELEVSLALLASFEAIIRSDFESPRRSSKGDSLVARFNALIARTPSAREPRLVDILDAWKAARGSGDVVGGFKEVVSGLRNWLAHGRRGPTKGFARFDPWTVRERAERLQASIPDFPRLLR